VKLHVNIISDQLFQIIISSSNFVYPWEAPGPSWGNPVLQDMQAMLLILVSETLWASVCLSYHSPSKAVGLRISAMQLIFFWGKYVSQHAQPQGIQGITQITRAQLLGISLNKSSFMRMYLSFNCCLAKSQREVNMSVYQCIAYYRMYCTTQRFTVWTVYLLVGLKDTGVIVW
jgi:hypothetical protein